MESQRLAAHDSTEGSQRCMPAPVPELLLLGLSPVAPATFEVFVLICAQLVGVLCEVVLFVPCANHVVICCSPVEVRDVLLVDRVGQLAPSM